MTGAATSLLAFLLFAPFFGVFLISSESRPEGFLYHILFILLTALFTFLGAWWILVPVSAGLGWCLYRVLIPKVIDSQ